KMKERGQVPWKDKIRQAIDTTMRESHISDFKTFKEKLGEFAVNVVERGRDLTYGLTGTNYKARGAKLGDDYKKETIFNELDRRNELQVGTSRERKGRTWLEGRGERLEQEQRARQNLAKRAESLQRRSLKSAKKSIQPSHQRPQETKERGLGGPSL
ncbi:relaxase, partial [Lactococcus lactis subsp. lactis]